VLEFFVKFVVIEHLESIMECHHAMAAGDSSSGALEGKTF